MILGLNSRNRGAAPFLLVAAGFALGIGAAVALRPGMPDRAIAAPVIEPSQRAGIPHRSVALAANYPADVMRVLDGDTFEARVRIWPGLEVTTKVRLRGIDAPELRARCTEERNQAQAARDALSALLARGGVGITQVSLDKYGGRVVADAVSHDTSSVAEALLASGHVRRYGGGRRASWCNGPPS